MQLKTLFVSGFKSFLDARLDFPPGVTAVVGPNGAGKSNIVDAVLWALGEQSAKTLRSERMEDVIFNGTESCPPVGMAEVSLVVGDVTSRELASLGGVMEELPGNKELMITRRLYRDGDSEYSINTIPCRLKDIRGLFWEARAGAKGHTVIEQGNIDAMLSGSPQDRRAFIEETAGIVRFKKQKLEALRKLAVTQQNLVRVRDIIAEVRKQLQALTRQARQAEHYHAMKAESRALEIRILKHEYDGLSERRSRAESDRAQLELRETALMAEQSRLAASHEALKESLLRDGELVGRAQEDLRRLEHDAGQALMTMEVERNRADAFARQRAQASEERARLSAEADRAVTAIADLREQAQRSEEAIARVTEELQVLETQERTLSEERAAAQTRTEEARQRVLDCAVERSHVESEQANFGAKQDELLRHGRDVQTGLEQCRRERSDTEDALAGRRAQVEQAVRDIDAARDRHAALSADIAEHEDRLREAEEQWSCEHTRRVASASRLQALQAVLREAFGYRPDGEADRSSLHTMCRGMKEALAERVDVPQEYEVAIEAALGEHIRAWVVDGVEAVPQALELMRSQGLGRGAVVLAQPQPSADPFAASWPALRTAQGVLGRAVDLIAVPDDLKEAWRCLLGRVALVETLADGLSALSRIDPADRGSVLLVTRHGETIDPRGVVTGGSAGDAAGLLQRRREVGALEQDVSAMDGRLAEHDDRRRAIREQCETLTRERRTQEASLKDAETRRQTLDTETSALSSRLRALEEREHELHTGCETCRDELARVCEQAAQAHTRLEDIGRRQRGEERQLEALTAQLRTFEDSTGALYKRVTETRLALATNRERHDRARADLDRVRDEEQGRRARIGSLAEQIESLQADSIKSREEHERAEARLQDLETRKADVERRRAELEARHTNGLQESRECERRLNDCRTQCASNRDARGETDIQLAEIRARVQSLEDTLRGVCGEFPDGGMDALLQSEGAPEPEGEVGEPDAWRERLRVIRVRMDRMGPLNLAAADEHRELEERCRFLDKQEKDLSESIQSLQEIIARLNRTTNRMFRETFDALQEKFQEVFAALFAGGKAELILVKPAPDPDDVPDGDTRADTEDALAVEHGVDIVVQPPGKRLKNLTMLSGGEKAMTALALMFASFLINPSPFCILDEVDAPLDEPNVIRFARFLTQLTSSSQFLVITHNKRTMEVANSLFGVTMEQPGVSKFVSVRIADLEQVS